MKGIKLCWRASSRWTLLLCVLIGATLPAACSTPPENTNRFAAHYPDIYRFVIHADAGSTIEGSWQSDVDVYAWYTAPDGAAYGLGQYQGGPLTLIEPWQDNPSVPYPVHRDGESYARLAATKQGNLQITTRPPYGGTGDYTLSFLPTEAKPDANIVVRYRVK